MIKYGMFVPKFLLHFLFFLVCVRAISVCPQRHVIWLIDGTPDPHPLKYPCFSATFWWHMLLVILVFLLPRQRCTLTGATQVDPDLHMIETFNT